MSATNSEDAERYILAGTQGHAGKTPLKLNPRFGWGRWALGFSKIQCSGVLISHSIVNRVTHHKIARKIANSHYYNRYPTKIKYEGPFIVHFP